MKDRLKENYLASLHKAHLVNQMFDLCQFDSYVRLFGYINI